MDNHPITLLQVLFTRSIVVSIPEHKGMENGKLKFSPENTINIESIPETNGRYAATMRTRLNSECDNSDPYMIDMECIGFFQVDESISREEAERAVMITAHNVLYGAIRESVLWITGRQPFGPLSLGLSILKSTNPE